MSATFSSRTLVARVSCARRTTSKKRRDCSPSRPRPVPRSLTSGHGNPAAMMSTGREPGMSQAVRVRTSSHIGASARCPECIRAAMCVSVDVGGGREESAGGRSFGPDPGLGTICSITRSRRRCRVKISEGFGRPRQGAGRRRRKTHLTFENLDAKGVDPVETIGVERGSAGSSGSASRRAGPG